VLQCVAAFCSVFQHHARKLEFEFQQRIKIFTAPDTQMLTAVEALLKEKKKKTVPADT